MKLINSIFISKNSEEVPLLFDFCKKENIPLISKSLIQFEAIPFVLESTYDVVFFASIRAAKYFLLQKTILDTTKIACIGETTALKLKQLGLHVDFIGTQSGKPEQVAKEFQSWLGTRKVLIPQSSKSKRTIAALLPEAQKIEVEVYTTVSKCTKVPACATYVFTSPSNFESFLLCNELNNPHLIAWGTTTKSAIEAKGFRVAETLENANELELIELLQSKK